MPIRSEKMQRSLVVNIRRCKGRTHTNTDTQKDRRYLKDSTCANEEKKKEKGNEGREGKRAGSKRLDSGSPDEGPSQD